MQLEPLRAYDDDDDVQDVSVGARRQIVLRPVPLLARLLESACCWVKQVIGAVPPPPVKAKQPLLLITDRPHWPVPPANPAKRPRDEPQPLPAWEPRPMPPPVPSEEIPPARLTKRPRDADSDEWLAQCTPHRVMQKPISEARWNAGLTRDRHDTLHDELRQLRRNQRRIIRIRND
jgi:hypothetical protein